MFTLLTSQYELPTASVESQSTGSISCRGQAGHQLPGAAPVFLQGLRRCQEVAGHPTPWHNVYLRNVYVKVKSKHDKQGPQTFFTLHDNLENLDLQYFFVYSESGGVDC